MARWSGGQRPACRSSLADLPVLRISLTLLDGPCFCPTSAWRSSLLLRSRQRVPVWLLAWCVATSAVSSAALVPAAAPTTVDEASEVHGPRPANWAPGFPWARLHGDSDAARPSFAWCG